MQTWETEFPTRKRMPGPVAQDFRTQCRHRQTRLIYPIGGEGSFVGLLLTYSLVKYQDEGLFGWGKGAKAGRVFAAVVVSGLDRVVIGATEQDLVEGEVKLLEALGGKLLTKSWK